MAGFIPERWAFESIGGFRARRHCAEQDSPGDRPSRGLAALKGGITMVKNVFCKAGIHRDATLVVVGWAAFLAGMLATAKYPILTVSSMAVARVLP